MNNSDEQFKKIGDDEPYVKEHFFHKLKHFAGKVPFVFEAVCLYYCALDAKTPLYARAIAFTALAYFILPTDLVADVLPIVGLTDDAGAIAAAIGSLSTHITAAHRNQASQLLYEKDFGQK